MPAKTRDIRDYINYAAVEPRGDEYTYMPHTRDVMEEMFNGKLIDRVISGTYEGDIVAAWRLEDDYYAIASSYFGSCTGCDRFLGATTEEAKDRIQSIATSARTFDSLSEMKTWVDEHSQDAEQYPMRHAPNLDLKN